MWIRRAEYELLRGEIEFWRQQFARERERADRLNDTVLSMIGRQPVSQEGIGEQREVSKEIKAQQAELSEWLTADNDEHSTDDLLAEFDQAAENAAGAK